MFELFFCLIVILYGFYKWATVNNEYFKKRNIVYLKPTIMLGNTGGLFMNQWRANEFISYLYNAAPTEKILGLFDFRKPFLMVRDPEMLKQMAVKDFDYFEDHRFFIDPKADKLFGNSLIMLCGEKWRDMRATLSPAFTGSKMRQMFDLINECACDMSTHFKQQVKHGKTIDLEMKNMFTKYTNDVIASSAFGITVNSFENEDNEFYMNGKRMMNFNSLAVAIRLLVIRMVPAITQALDLQFLDSKATKFFRAMILNTFNVREKENIFRPDMINIMMQVKKGSESFHEKDDKESSSIDGFATVEEAKIATVAVKHKWNDDEIIAQCIIFFLAGFDTSSTLLSFTSHELAINPDIQGKLAAEISETNQRLNGEKISYDDLQKMKYLDMVITESLRMWPPAMFTDRLCVKNYEYDDGKRRLKIEKGTSFWIPIYGFHHDPQYFPNPSKFDPERFSEENKDKIVPNTYLPFGIGPRNCIGSRFALMEVKAVLYYLLLNFKFEPNAKTQIPLKLYKGPGAMNAEKGINLRLTAR